MEKKTIYLAGKLNAGEASIAEFGAELESRGHTILEKWYEKGELPKPYLDNMRSSTPAAAAMIRAAYRSDVFILFADNEAFGAMAELGIALGSTETNHRKELYVLRPPEEFRQSIFYADSHVAVVDTLDQIRKKDWF